MGQNQDRTIWDGVRRHWRRPDGRLGIPVDGTDHGRKVPDGVNVRGDGTCLCRYALVCKFNWRGTYLLHITSGGTCRREIRNRPGQPSMLDLDRSIGTTKRALGFPANIFKGPAGESYRRNRSNRLEACGVRLEGRGGEGEGVSLTLGSSTNRYVCSCAREGGSS